MSSLTARQRVDRELDRLKASGIREFCPVDVGLRLGMTGQEVAIKIVTSDRDDVYRVRRATGPRQGWQPSRWAFKPEVTA